MVPFIHMKHNTKQNNHIFYKLRTLSLYFNFYVYTSLVFCQIYGIEASTNFFSSPLPAYHHLSQNHLETLHQTRSLASVQRSASLPIFHNDPPLASIGYLSAETPLAPAPMYNLLEYNTPAVPSRLWLASCLSHPSYSATLYATSR